MAKKREPRGNVGELEARIGRYKRAKALLRERVVLLEGNVSRLEAILHHSCGTFQVKPRKAAPWELPRVVTPGGLPVGSD